MNTSSVKCHRQSVRLKNYDYSQNGAYFLTICIQGRECLLGEIMNGEIDLNHFGRIILEEWENSSNVRPEIELDAFIIKPNHIHGIVVIGTVGARPCAPTIISSHHAHIDTPAIAMLPYPVFKRRLFRGEIWPTHPRLSSKILLTNPC